MCHADFELPVLCIRGSNSLMVTTLLIRKVGDRGVIHAYRQLLPCRTAGADAAAASAEEAAGQAD